GSPGIRLPSLPRCRSDPYWHWVSGVIHLSLNDLARVLRFFVGVWTHVARAPKLGFTPHTDEGRMKRIWTIFLLANAVRAADVTLWITGDWISSVPVSFAALNQAKKMFDSIGVRVDWKAGKTGKPENPDDGVVIEVRFTIDTPGRPGAMAFTN